MKDEKVAVQLPLLFNSTVAAERLGICKRVILEEVEKGRIRCIKKNGRLWFREVYLLEYVSLLEKETEEGLE